MKTQKHADLIENSRSFTYQASQLYKIPNFGNLDKETLKTYITELFNKNDISISDEKIKKYQFELNSLKNAKQIQFWLGSKILAGSNLKAI